MRRSLLLLSLVVAAHAHADRLRYSITYVGVTELGTLGGLESAANDINRYGHITGWADVANGRHAFLYRDGVMRDIHFTEPTSQSYGVAINARSEVVGRVYRGRDREIGDLNRPFFYNGAGTELSLDITEPVHDITTSRGSFATGINLRGAISGNVNGTSVVWPSAGGRPVPVFDPARSSGVYDYADDINDSDVVVGLDQGQYGAYRAVSRVITYVPYPEPLSSRRLGIDGYHIEEDYSHAINNAGEVVGHVTFDHWLDAPASEAREEYLRASYWRGVETSAGSAIPLGTLPGGRESDAFDINNQRFVVGWSEELVRHSSGEQFVIRAFVWHPDFGMVALLAPSSTYVSCTASGVNDRNENGLVQVVGACADKGGSRAVRWDVYTELVRDVRPDPCAEIVCAVESGHPTTDAGLSGEP
jgi:probable HAF family extracellular repeat protein